ncbi:phosphotransferase [Nocardioides sp. NPDC101246]|uniref:phosphotransferase n=1 Tax=Nocardioides sp. NPDC101246 TaxID=3364336 RepID=UPI0037F97DE9
MWQPDPGWLVLPGGTGPSTLGVWRTAVGEDQEPVVVKRLGRPGTYDPAELGRRRHFAYWRRAADVATSGLVDDTPGMIGAHTSVAEDDEGITLTTDWVEDAANSGLFAALSMGRFAGADLGEARWLARDQFRDRIARVEYNGGWPTMTRTTAADIAHTLWERRGRFTNLLDELPQVAQHGDPVPQNLLGRTDDGERLVAIDWSSLGHGPVGGDLGLYLLHARESFEPLLEAYVLGLPSGVATREEVRLGAQISAVYTALSRAEWALSRITPGEGPLLAKFRHPAVAPHLRNLQRQAPLVEALLAM